MWLSANNFHEAIWQIKYFEIESPSSSNLLEVLNLIQTTLWHSCRYIKKAIWPWKKYLSTMYDFHYLTGKFSCTFWSTLHFHFIFYGSHFFHSLFSGNALEFGVCLPLAQFKMLFGREKENTQVLNEEKSWLQALDLLWFPSCAAWSNEAYRKYKIQFTLDISPPFNIVFAPY